jgi:response regulator NasT
VGLPDGDGLTAASEICRGGPLPVVVVSACHDPAVVRRAADQDVAAYLVKPVVQSDLGPAIAVALRHFELVRTLRQEADDLRQALEDRKLIERAKGMVMRYAGQDEPESFRRLRKMASDNNQKLIEVARAVIAAGEVFRLLEQPEGPSDGRTRHARESSVGRANLSGLDRSRRESPM